MSNAKDPESHGEAGAPAREVPPEHIRAVRLGHGANCSSIGSVIDTLFVGALAAGAIFAAIAAALAREDVKVAGDRAAPPAQEKAP
jgi:hypothetical protein